MSTRPRRPRAVFASALALGAALVLALPLAAPAQQPKTLRVTMHADVRSIDPFWSTQTIIGIHANMIYDRCSPATST